MGISSGPLSASALDGLGSTGGIPGSHNLCTGSNPPQPPSPSQLCPKPLAEHLIEQ
ncbi:unnamed protein product [Knipowitschia caucasica]